MSVKRRYFGTDGIRGPVGGHPINPEFILKLGWAAGRVLGGESDQRGQVLIGKDTRVSGYLLESALEAGLSAAGMDICLMGPMPTPAVAYLTRTFRAQAGIMISASHNPYHDNGIKFFSSQGTKLADHLELAIEEKMDAPLETVESRELGKATRLPDAVGRYLEFCKSTVASSVNLSGLTIVLDCANGATYHVAPSVFSELGATVIDIAVNPDGFNINEGCGSTEPTALQNTVVRTKADLGIAFDGDGDRIIMVDHTGAVVDGDELLYIIAKAMHQAGTLSGGVVGTVMSNLGLEIALRDLNIPFVRTAVGDRHVLAELQRQGWLLGGELSGHLLCLSHVTTGDAIVAALQVLAALQQFDCSLHEAKSSFSKLPQVLINVNTSQKNDILAHTKMQEALQTAETQLSEQGRVLLRPSGTEAMIRVMVEGENSALIQQVADELADQVRTLADSLA